jgi:hypothetical protein
MTVYGNAKRPTKNRARKLAIGATSLGLMAAAGITWVVTAGAASAWQNSTFSPFDVPSGVGASVPFTEYEAEGTHATNTGSTIGPDYTQGTVASEASGRRAVSLGQGQYVQYTLTASANAVDVSYNLARGAAGTLSIYVNGSKISPKLQLNSKYSYLDTNIGGSKTHHLFDDARVMLGTTANVGDTVRFQVDSGDVATTVDVADFENVAAAATAPAGSVSVTSKGADPAGAGDSTNAFNQAIQAAKSAGTSVWVPPGTYTISSTLQADNVTIRGAGPWYSTLHGTHLFDNGSASGPLKLYDFAAIGEVTTRNDSSPDNFVNGSVGNGAVIQNIWVQHEKVGLWLVGNNNTNITIQNNRIIDTEADGINFNGTVTNSTIKNNFFRNNGDDSIALWSLYAADANNTIANNTAVQPNLANGIALYGGTSNTLTNNVVADTNALGSGIAISNQQFIANGTFAPLAGTITISGNYLIRAGALNPNWGHPMGAIRFDAFDFPISNVTINFSGGKIIDSPYSAIEMVGGDGTGRPVTGLNVSGVTIQNSGTVAVQAEDTGSGTFTNVVATGNGAAGLYNCPFPTSAAPFAFNLGSGNSGWNTPTWPCANGFPSPGNPGGTGGPTTGGPTGGPTTPPASGTNVALHKTASGTSSVSPYAPGNATDGDVNTYWESNSNAWPQSLTVDLGAAYSVNKVAMFLPPAAAWAARTQTVAVATSTDGTTYTGRASGGYAFDPGSGNTASATFAAATARYVRLTFTGNTGWPAAQLSELQVLTAGGTTASPTPTATASPTPTATTSPTPTSSPTPTAGTDRNLAQGKSTTSTGFVQTYTPANAVDGNPNTYWESTNNAFPQSITIDLGAVYTVDKVVLFLPPSTGWATRSQTITTATSTDNSTYTTRAGPAGYTFSPATGNTVSISFTAVQARYIRLTFTANSGWPAAQLSEAQVMGH